MRRGIDRIKKSDTIILKSDKTGSHCYTNSESYRKAITTDVCKFYKNPDHNWENTINQEAQALVTELKLEDVILTLYKEQAFVAVKKHNDNFRNNPQFLLHNPAKNIIGNISKNIIY